MKKLLFVGLLILTIITACSGGAPPAELKIPAPPQYRHYEQGQDALLDQLVSVMNVESELLKAAGQQGASVKVLDKNIYTSEADAQEVADFYEREMRQRGWRSDDTQDATGMYVRTFAAGNDEYGAAIIILDPSVLYEEPGAVYVWTFSAQQIR